MNEYDIYIYIYIYRNSLLEYERVYVMVNSKQSTLMRFTMTGQVLLRAHGADDNRQQVPPNEPPVVSTWSGVLRFEEPLYVWYCRWSAVHCVPLRMARSGAIALWCQTVMSRVQGKTINTMARISLLFGISRIGYLARHYLEKKQNKYLLSFCIL